MKKINPEGWLGPQKESIQQTTLVWAKGGCLEAGRRWMKSCCFNSADCAYVSVRKCLKSTGNSVMHLKQYLTMQSSPLIYHSWTFVSACQMLRGIMKCIMLTAHLEFVPHPGIFIQNLRLWDKGIFAFFLTVWFLLNVFLILLFVLHESERNWLSLKRSKYIFFHSLRFFCSR